MKDTVGMLLREAWNRSGHLECIHAELSLERSISGVLTGAYVCTKCGRLMKTIDPSRPTTIHAVGK